MILGRCRMIVGCHVLQVHKQGNHLTSTDSSCSAYIWTWSLHRWKLGINRRYHWRLKICGKLKVWALAIHTYASAVWHFRQERIEEFVKAKVRRRWCYSGSFMRISTSCCQTCHWKIGNDPDIYLYNLIPALWLFDCNFTQTVWHTGHDCDRRWQGRLPI